MSNSDFYSSFMKTVRSYVGLDSPKTKKNNNKKKLINKQHRLQKKTKRRKNNTKMNEDFISMTQQAIIKKKFNKQQKQRAIKAIANRDFQEMEKVLKEYTKTIQLK